MKYITHIFRILVGALFIFSGFIKSNDTKGFGIKLHEYFEVFANDFEAKQDTFSIIFTSPWHEEEYEISLYEGEKNKTYTVNSTLSEESFEVIFEDIDSATGVKKESVRMARELIIACAQATNIILRDTLYEADSLKAGDLKVAAAINSKNFYNKTHPLIISKIEIMESIDVSKYLKKSSWIVGFLKSLGAYADGIAIFLVLLELLLGFCLLIGFKTKLTVWALLLMTLFFTFLTFYSAYFNKVTDCGCFGDAIKLRPWESFQKDVILTVLILWLFFTSHFIRPLFSLPFSKSLLLVMMFFCAFFTMYCYLYLPVFDFLKYSEGSDLRKRISTPKGELTQDIVEKIMIYKDSANKEISIVYNSERNSFTPNIPLGATFFKLVSEKILKIAYKPEIHDWLNIIDQNGIDVSDSIMLSKGYTLLLISSSLSDVHKNVQPKINKLYESWLKTNAKFYALTSSGNPEIAKYTSEKDVKYPFCLADNKLLASMIRSNPGLILIKDGIVLKRWSFRNLPKPEKLVALIQ